MATRGNLRASDAEREQVAERLRRATAEGRLAADELEHRLGIALSARTHSELNSTVADLPGGRLGQRRSKRQRALTVVRAHPVLLFVAIPVLLVAVAMLIAFTVLWFTLAVVATLLFGRRGHPAVLWGHGPRRRGHLGPARRTAGGYTPWL